LAKVQASVFSLMPTPILTPDQVESLKTNNIVGKDALDLAALGVQPTAMRSILPTYLNRYQPGGRFAKIKKAS